MVCESEGNGIDPCTCEETEKSCLFLNFLSSCICVIWMALLATVDSVAVPLTQNPSYEKTPGCALQDRVLPEALHFQT